MEARAEFRYLRIPDRKIRVVMELVKGKKIDVAMNALKFTNKRGCDIVSKLLKSAIANITAKQGVDIEKLFVKTAYANQGPSFKKLHARAMGRGGVIKRKFCHASIIVSDEFKEPVKKGRTKIESAKDAVKENVKEAKAKIAKEDKTKK
ncbi:MAG: 50S ribosomal protein L22 [Candidatus Firestonebacteria bacterium GWA2_43_8]|nr:ribosomal protein L22 [uncultured bacterium]OGF52173.1 MAG: 50S ribosomal protein L22 [Candidatus Firestonebacteria bacterium GWA2_43_8]